MYNGNCFSLYYNRLSFINGTKNILKYMQQFKLCSVLQYVYWKKIVSCLFIFKILWCYIMYWKLLLQGVMLLVVWRGSHITIISMWCHINNLPVCRYIWIIKHSLFHAFHAITTIIADSTTTHSHTTLHYHIG